MITNQGVLHDGAANQVTGLHSRSSNHRLLFQSCGQSYDTDQSTVVTFQPMKRLVTRLRCRALIGREPRLVDRAFRPRPSVSTWRRGLWESHQHLFAIGNQTFSSRQGRLNPLVTLVLLLDAFNWKFPPDDSAKSESQPQPTLLIQSSSLS